MAPDCSGGSAAVSPSTRGDDHGAAGGPGDATRVGNVAGDQRDSARHRASRRRRIRASMGRWKAKGNRNVDTNSAMRPCRTRCASSPSSPPQCMHSRSSSLSQTTTYTTQLSIHASGMKRTSSHIDPRAKFTSSDRAKSAPNGSHVRRASHPRALLESPHGPSRSQGCPDGPGHARQKTHRL